MVFRCFIDINDSSITEKSLSDRLRNWEWFTIPPFIDMNIDKVDAGFGTKEWLLHTTLQDIIKEKKSSDYWNNIGNEILASFEKPAKVGIYLDRDIVFFKESPGYDSFYNVNLTVTKVKENPPFDFSGDDLSTDSRFW